MKQIYNDEEIWTEEKGESLLDMVMATVLTVAAGAIIFIWWFTTPAP